jgi:phosphohistidine phosphatase
MDLILWRHADAQDAPEGGEDLDRPLTARGGRQATRVAHWLNPHLPAKMRILASPALRAQQTAAALERRFKTVAALAPDGSVAGLLSAARWPDAGELVLVVGHQPTLGLAAAYLLAGVVQAWSVKKGALWWLRRQDRPGDEQIVLVAVRGPENV